MPRTLSKTAAAATAALLACAMAGCSQKREVTNQLMYSGATFTGTLRTENYARPDGFGVMVYPDGARYEGYWKRGNFDGKGKYSSPAGASYEGEFREGVAFDVSGTMVFADGTKFTGHWNRAIARGAGAIVYADGRKYSGQWIILPDSSGLPDGDGEMTYPDGGKYTGSFRDGKPHGVGTLVSPAGVKKYGVWQAGTFVGPIGD